MIYVDKQMLLALIEEEVGQLETVGDMLVFHDKHDCSVKLCNAMENAIYDYERGEKNASN